MVNRMGKDARSKRPRTGATFKEGAGAFGPSAFFDQWFTKVKPKDMTVIKQQKQSGNPDQAPSSIDDEIAAIITQNPGINAATFLNLLKSKGIKLVKSLTEADSGTGLSQLTRAQGHKQSRMNMRGKFKFREKGEPAAMGTQGKPADPMIGFQKFRVVMIEEGLGNFGDAFFYSRECLDKSAPIFEGKKIYADHPSQSEEQDLPERSVRDVLGHFENVHIEEADGGQAQMVADVCILPDDSFRWARSLMGHAVEYQKKFPDKEFIGLSINASGSAEPMMVDDLLKKSLPESIQLKLKEAKDKGVEQLKFVSELDDAVSCDLVTEAGAGGKVTSFLESKSNQTKGDTMSAKDKKAALKESEAGHKEGHHEDGAANPGQADHADASQDIELIKSMLKKAFGDEEPSESEMKACHEAYEGCKEMGEEKESAMEKAIHAMKLAKHMAAKQAKKEAEMAQSKEGEEPPPKKDAPADDGDGDDDSKEKPDMAKKESAKLRAENITLRGELAKFREGDKKRAVADHVEKVCRESKLSNKVTGEFKELVKESKSVEEVNKAWKLFEAGYKRSGSQALDFAFNEKEVGGAEGSKAGVDFSDCTQD